VQSKKWKKQPESGMIQKALLSMFHGSRKRQLFILGIDIPSRCFRIISYYMVFFSSWAKRFPLHGWQKCTYIIVLFLLASTPIIGNWVSFTSNFNWDRYTTFSFVFFFLLDEIEAKFLIAIVCWQHSNIWIQSLYKKFEKWNFPSLCGQIFVRY